MATDRALYIGERRLPWDRVARVTWDADESVLTVVGGVGEHESAQTIDVAMVESTQLLEVIRLEVTSNIVVAQRIDGPRFGGAWVTARRVPGADELRWTVVFDPGRDPRDPELRAWADEKVAVIRRSTGV